MLSTTPDVVKAINADRLREVERIHLLAAAANARPRNRNGLGERIRNMFKHEQRAAGGAHAALE